MWELYCEESWTPKNWCFWSVVLEKTLEGPLNCKEIQPVHSKRKSVPNIHWKDWCWSWNSNTLATWCKKLSYLKRSDAGKDWKQEKRTTEDEMVGWHHWLNGHELTQTHVYWVSDTIQPSHPLLSPSPPALNLSQHQCFFKWISSSHQMARVLVFQLQHQSFQKTPRTELL